MGLGCLGELAVSPPLRAGKVGVCSLLCPPAAGRLMERVRRESKLPGMAAGASSVPAPALAGPGCCEVGPKNFLGCTVGKDVGCWCWLLAVSLRLRLDIRVSAEVQVSPVGVLEADVEVWCSGAGTMDRKGEERQICVPRVTDQKEDK